MLCEQMQRYMDFKIDGSLPADKEKLLDAHMNECLDCRQEYFQLKALVHYLRETPIEQVPPDFMDNVMAQVRIPLHYRMRDLAIQSIPRLFYHPAIIIGVIVAIILSFASYLMAFKTLFELLIIEGLHDQLVDMIQEGGVAYSLTKIMLTLAATLWTTLSYFIPVVIVGLFLCSIILFYFLNNRRFTHA